VTSKFKRLRKIAFLVFTLFTICACTEQNYSLGNLRRDPESVTNRLKLLVGEAGIYRVTTADLAVAGITLDEELRYENVLLSTGPVEVPYWIDGDALIFYGQPANDRYYAKRPYMLQIGQSGQAMDQWETQAEERPSLAYVRKTLRLEEDNYYVPESRDGESDVWFWSKLSQQDRFTAEFSLPSVAENEAILRFHVWGFSQIPNLEYDHDFEILVNDQPASVAVFDGQRHYTGEITLPPNTLKAGANTIILDNRQKESSTLDIFYLDWLELEYPAPPAAVNDRLDFTSNDGKVISSGWSGSPVVLDISDPDQPRLLQEALSEDGQMVLAPEAGRHLAAAGPRGFLSPEITAVQMSHWLDESNQADLLIITTNALAPALAPLVNAREVEGLSVAVVTLDEIYDGVGFGVPSPESIRDFVTYAYQNWQDPQPRYLLLVGDASNDYLGRLGPLPENNVPSLMVPVQINGETVSDSRLADVDDDGRPELAVGRWPVRTVEDTEALVKRTLAYEADPAGSKVLFVTDGSDESFGQIAGRIIDAGQLNSDQVIVVENPTAEEIGELWQENPWLAAYLGHGSIDRWGKENIFNLQELDKLKGQTSPIVLQLTCLTGMFSDPEQVSLAEGMLLHPNGPVLVIAASSLTFSYHQEPFAAAFLQQLHDTSVELIGDAFISAKEGLDIENYNGYREISDTFALFGDPSAKISRP
jgi:hypothetical protein